MNYLSVAQARERRGLRLVLTAGVPGPWGEAAKAVFRLRHVPYLPVEQIALAPNEDLLAWTSHRNAPIVVLDEQPPITGWLDILALAERLGSGDSLLPCATADRALAIGLTNEIAGYDGLGWWLRLSMLHRQAAGGAIPAALGQVFTDYGYTPERAVLAPKRAAAILAMLSETARRQRRAGSSYLVGGGLTICDIYWATFSMMLSPLPAEVNPMPESVRALYSAGDPAVMSALDSILIELRDRVFAEHIGLPLDFLFERGTSLG